MHTDCEASASSRHGCSTDRERASFDLFTSAHEYRKAQPGRRRSLGVGDLLIVVVRFESGKIVRLLAEKKKIQLVERRSIVVVDVPAGGDQIGERVGQWRNEQVVPRISEVEQNLLVVEQTVWSIGHGDDLP